MQNELSRAFELLNQPAILLKDVSKSTGISAQTLSKYRKSESNLEDASFKAVNKIVKYYDSLGVDFTKPIERVTTYRNTEAE